MLLRGPQSTSELGQFSSNSRSIGILWFASCFRKPCSAMRQKYVTCVQKLLSAGKKHVQTLNNIVASEVC